MAEVMVECRSCMRAKMEDVGRGVVGVSGVSKAMFDDTKADVGWSMKFNAASDLPADHFRYGASTLGS